MTTVQVQPEPKVPWNHERSTVLIWFACVHCWQRNKAASWSVEVPGVKRLGLEKSILWSTFIATIRTTVEDAAAAATMGFKTHTFTHMYMHI